MLKKVKRTRNILALLSAVSLVIALVLTALALSLTLSESYAELWYIIPVSVACYYCALTLGFFAVDRSGAVRLLAAVQTLGDTNDESALAREMGWKLKPTKKLFDKCKKKGYIS